jgi:hypothetical protein
MFKAEVEEDEWRLVLSKMGHIVLLSSMSS